MKRAVIVILFLMFLGTNSFAAVWSSSAGTITKINGYLTVSVNILKDGVLVKPFTAPVDNEADAIAKITSELKKYSDVDSFDVSKIGPVTYTPPVAPGPPSAAEIAKAKFITDLTFYRGMLVAQHVCNLAAMPVVCLMDPTDKAVTDQWALVQGEFLPAYAAFMGGMIVP